MLLVGLPLHELAMPNALAEVSKEADLAKVSKEADLAIALVKRPHLRTVTVEVVLGELQRGGGPVERAILVAAVLLAPRQLLQVCSSTRAHTAHHNSTAGPSLLCQRLLRRSSSASRPIEG